MVIGRLADSLLFPLRVLLADEKVERLGLTSLRQERVNAVAPELHGRTLDIACGHANPLRPRGGLGMDVVRYPGIDVQGRAENLPVRSAGLDRVVILGSLEYIPGREAALREIRRVLRPDGKLLLTSTTPLVCRWRWRLAVWTKYANPPRGGFQEREMRELLTLAGFAVERVTRFACGCNRLYVAQRI